MGVRVGGQAAQRIEAAAGTFPVHVLEPSDRSAATAALRLARLDLLGLAAGRQAASDREVEPHPSVSPVVNAPGGPLLLVEHFSNADLARAVTDIVVKRLEKASVDSAVVDVPAVGGALETLDAVPNAVVLRLFPMPRGGATVLPLDWLDTAADWVTADTGDVDPIALRILGAEFEVASADAGMFIHECGVARAWCDAVTGALDDRVRTASLTFGRLPHLALAAAGPQVDRQGQLARFHLLQEIARELAADVAFACIDFEPTLEGLATGLSPAGWQAQGGAPPNDVVRELGDERVPDAYPYQVLGPGHLAHLDGRSLPAEPLGDGRVEVSFEHPRSWLPGSSARSDARSAAWDRLEPLLATQEELTALVDERGVRATGDGVAADDIHDIAVGSVPELEATVLERETHADRGSRLSLLELVSWMADEPHTDFPKSVAPVLATYARWLAAGLDDANRQDLKRIAPRLIGTAPATEQDERTRRWFATDLLVRGQAVAWLRAAGLTDIAGQLESLATLREHTELVRAVDLLGSAIDTASRRIEIMASLVSDGTVEVQPDEPLVWAAWERVTETTGCVATSEAATDDAPAALTYATNFRVIECSRDQRVRDELSAANKSVGDAVWSTAMHAVADEAWERGWQAADRASRESSGFSVRTEIKRVATALDDERSEWDDGDDPESSLAVAERAARESLTRAVLAGGVSSDDGHPWDDARNAARTSAGGKEWAVVNDEARRSIGEDAWAQAMSDARAEVAAVLEGAADAVARTVAAAVAREASSAAARGVALRAASVARADSLSDDEVEEAVNAALDVIATPLQRDAVALLERMIDPVPDTTVELRGETGAIAPVSTQHSS